MYDTVQEITLQTIEENGELREQATDPAVVLVPSKPSRAVTRLSRNAFTDIVPVSKAVRTLRDTKGSALAYGSGMGLVGALAAVGQTLERDHTYELIAYRAKENLGTPRRVDEESVRRMDRLTSPRTFNNYDTENRRVLITPHGPDPVLLGIRGETPQSVRDAFRLLRIHEPIERWVIFRTNHGTDSHFQSARYRPSLKVYCPVRLEGIVCTKPERISGGHVFIKLLSSRRIVHCAAFEPTGKFKEVVAKLIPGDKVTVFGGVKSHGDNRSALTINLEKIMIDHLVEDNELQNPKCPECGKRMKSAGRGQGFRCKRCRCVAPRASKQSVPMQREIQQGLYIPDLKAHRHLTKPLCRYGREKKRWDGKPPTGIWHEP
jgi:tRNA(Ile2)-agmatinylcytidine synthase